MQDKSNLRRRWQRRLVLSFTAAFAVFAVVMTVCQVRFDRQEKLMYVENDLSSYADILSRSDDYAYLSSLFPSDLRATVLDHDGNVLFDSEGSGSLANHSDRPEINSLTSDGSVSTSIRVSATTGKKYLYYSKSYADRIVRVALPYDEDVVPQIRPNSFFLLVSALLFAVSLLVIILVSSYVGADIGSFQEKYKSDSDREVATIKQQMTSNISHELRTPVTGIMGYLETLDSCPDMDEAQRRNFIHRAHMLSVRLSDLIRDVALISKIEESPEKLEKQIVNLHDIFDDAAGEFASALEEKGDVLEDMLPEDLRICGNRVLLHSMFRNLLENSLKYAGEGVNIRICLCPFSEAGLEGSDDSICLCFYDTGRGVPQEHLLRIFERFYRVSEGRTRDAGGSGLGLSIVRNAVAFHGGSINAKNRSPHGLQFFFTLKK